MSAKKNRSIQKKKIVLPAEPDTSRKKKVPSIQGWKQKNLPYYIGLAVVLLLIILIRKNYLTIPFERDEGSYAYAGKIILNGAKTFTDIGSQRLDGVFYAYAVLVAFFGYTVKALHVAFLLVNLVSTCLLFLLVKKLINSITALIASLFFALLSMDIGASGFTIQSEHLVAFACIAGFLSLFYFLEKNKIWLLIITGVLFSIAFQLKQTSAFFGFFAGLLIIYKGYFVDKTSIKKLILYASVFSAAVFIPIVIDLLVIYMNGAWTDFKLWFFDIRNQYSSLLSFSQGLKHLKQVFAVIYKNYEFLWIFSVIGSIAIFFTSLPLWKKIFIGGLYAMGLLTVIPGLHFYGHYFLQWIPAVSISAAAFIFSVYDILQNKFKLKKSAFAVSALITIFPVISNLKNSAEYYFNPDETAVLRKAYGGNPFPESKVVADKLNTLMKEEDKLVVLGTEIQMYVYTNKFAPSRFAGCGALLEFPISQSNAWQKEFIADVEKAAPKYMVYYSMPVSWMINPKSEDLIFPWFNKFSKNYKIIGYAEMFSNTTKYVWEPDVDLVNHPLKSTFVIYVLERI